MLARSTRMIAKNPDTHRVRFNAIINGIIVHKRAIGNKPNRSLWTTVLSYRVRNELLEQSVKVIGHGNNVITQVRNTPVKG